MWNIFKKENSVLLGTRHWQA